MVWHVSPTWKAPARMASTRMARVLMLLWLVTCGTSLMAQDSRFAMTHSRSEYVHWIDLYDSQAQIIDPTDPEAPPYSPQYTCGKCHDYQAISHGFHFNAPDPDVDPAVPGEPWVWTDTRTGTRLPLSYRGWSGTYHPLDLGIRDWDFVLKFGRHLPGGGPGEHDVSAQAVESASDTEAAGPTIEYDDPARWHLSGQLDVDCMICHSRHMSFSAEKWWEQIQQQNFAWAHAAAAGLATIDGAVSRLPDDFDPEEVDEDSRDTLPKTIYQSLQMNAQNQVFFDVVGKPSDNSCYYCHTSRLVGENSTQQWNHDQDVHLQAGMSCSDCHRNGIEHHTVRGFEGEQHPTGANVSTLSCRGCHMDDQPDAAHLPGGRLGAPKPQHLGLPPLHLDKLSCTACHSGPQLSPEANRMQLARTHELGLPSHHLSDDTPPGIVGPVLIKKDDTLYPNRLVWPAFWGSIQGDTITPLNPEVVHSAIRRIFRVRRTSTFAEKVASVRLSNEEKVEVLGPERAKVPESELTDDEQAKLEELIKAKAWEEFQAQLVEAFQELQEKAIEQDDAHPVYVAGGRVYRQAEDGSLEEFSHAAAKPYAWHMAHDVRPARWSTGAGADGCYECHTLDAPLVDATVTAIGPAPSEGPVTKAMHEFAELDKFKMDAWSLSFLGRSAFKWFGFLTSGIVFLVLLSSALIGLQGLARMMFRK